MKATQPCLKKKLPASLPDVVKQWSCLLGGLLLLAQMASFARCAVPGQRDGSRPNIVLIVSDDQGWQDLGCYGSTEVRTPNLDRLAETGVRLTSFYVTWPACTPSRGSILTGRYPQRNGTYDMFRNDLVDYGFRYDKYSYAVSWEMIGGMDVREILLPQLLKPEGYYCGAFGKWDLGQLRRYLPLQRGFDEYYGFTNTGIDYFTHERYGVPSMRRGNELIQEDKGTYATYLFEREALRFIDENHDRPFFLYVAFNAPHIASSLDPQVRGTVQAPDEYLKLYPEVPAGDRRANRRRGYMAAITCMDAAIGRIIDRLEHYQIRDNTLVIFLSDNGGPASMADNGPFRGGKSQLFEGGVRVPCIVSWPAALPKGKVCEEFLTALELFPTVVAAAGAKVPDFLILDGFNMLPVLQGKQRSPRQEMFWRRRGDCAARVGQWKWVQSSKGGGLFDLQADPGETTDLSDKRPDVLQMVKSRFAAWEREMAQAEPRGPFRDY